MDGSAREIEVEVRDGRVILSGTVNSRAEKHMSEDTVEPVSGVRDVQNHIYVAARQ